MMKSAYIITLIFILLHFIISPFDKSISFRILIYSLILFSVTFILWGLIKIFKEKYNNGLILLFSGIILATSFLKIWFYYYNIYLNLSLLILSGSVFFILYRSYNVKLKSLIFSITFLVLGFTLTFVNDVSLFKYLNKGIGYQSIKWEHFQGRQNKDSKYDAEIKCGLKYKVNYLSNPTPYVIYTAMFPEDSWKRENAKKKDFDALLNHEQGHLDLVKIYEEKAKDSLNSVIYSPESYDEIINYFIKEQRKASSEYDEFSSHGYYNKKQKIWDQRIDSLKQVYNVLPIPNTETDLTLVQKKAIKQAELCISINNKVSKEFNTRNKFILRAYSKDNSDRTINSKDIRVIDSISVNIDKALQNAIYSIKKESSLSIDNQLYQETLDLLYQLKKLEVIFKQYQTSIIESNKSLEKKLAVRLREKASKFKLFQKKWAKKKEQFLSENIISSIHLNLDD